MEVNEGGFGDSIQTNVRMPLLIKTAFNQVAQQQRKTLRLQANEAIQCYLGFEEWPVLNQTIPLSDTEKTFIHYFTTPSITPPPNFRDVIQFPQGKLEQVNVRMSSETNRILKVVAGIQRKYLETVVVEAFLEYLDIIPRQNRDYSHLTELVNGK